MRPDVLFVCWELDSTENQREWFLAALRQYSQRAEAFGLEGSSLILWIGSDEIYGHGDSDTQDVEKGVADKYLRLLQEVGKGIQVTILGPLPRYRHDAGCKWESTAAFRLDRSWFHRVVEELPNATMIPYLGRLLCASTKNPLSKNTKNAVLHRENWRKDGIHPSELSLDRILAKLDTLWERPE